MKPVLLALVAGLFALPVAAQQEDGLARASGAILRGLDKVAGISTDIPIRVNQKVNFDQISVTLKECRYPSDDPASNAYAYLEITEKDGKTDFEGWMIADSPALSALDHPRYDIWVIRCSNS